MRFPGSKLLSQNLSTDTTPFDSVVRNCEDVNLSGYVEIAFSDAEGLILFYLGEQIRVIYRAGSDIFISNDATLKLRNTAQNKEGKVSIYELPLDIAHMLRGLSNRKEIFGQIFAPEPLKELLKKLEEDGHTGSLEVITNRGSGMILLVRGRFSNCYFETEDGVTFEKRDAVNRIYELLGRPETSAHVFQSDFSPDQWKSRHETQRVRRSRLHEILEQKRPQEAGATPTTEAPSAAATPVSEMPLSTTVKDRKPLQRKVLTDIKQHTPSILAAFFFDMDTEEIELDLIEAPNETEDRLIVEKLPAFVKFLENLAAIRNDDHVEELSLSTEHFYLIVKCIPETGEGLALITDKSQPVTLAASLLLNSANRYVLMLSGAQI